MSPPSIPPWRFRGRPFDPRQRRLSRGEQQQRAVDAVVYGAAGVLAAVMFLAYAASVVIR